MPRIIILLTGLAISSTAFATMKIHVEYPNGKLTKSVKVYKSKGKAYAVLQTKKGEVSKAIPLQVFDQTRKNFLGLGQKKKQTEFACPKRIRLTLSINDKVINYCKSTKLKKSAAKLFNRLEKMILKN